MRYRPGNGCYRVEPRRTVAWDYGAFPRPRRVNATPDGQLGARAAGHQRAQVRLYIPDLGLIAELRGIQI